MNTLFDILKDAVLARTICNEMLKSKYDDFIAQLEQELPQEGRFKSTKFLVEDSHHRGFLFFSTTYTSDSWGEEDIIVKVVCSTRQVIIEAPDELISSDGRHIKETLISSLNSTPRKSAANITLHSGLFSEFPERDLAFQSLVLRQGSVMLLLAKTENLKVWVAKDGEEIIGWATSHTINETKIVHVFVQESYRRQGLGSKLISKIEGPFLIMSDDSFAEKSNIYFGFASKQRNSIGHVMLEKYHQANDDLYMTYLKQLK
jgi:GNAT superfamily N-acetyltransferase